jgi:hypothetical protein
LCDRGAAECCRQREGADYGSGQVVRLRLQAITVALLPDIYRPEMRGRLRRLRGPALSGEDKELNHGGPVWFLRSPSFLIMSQGRARLPQGSPEGSCACASRPNRPPGAGRAASLGGAVAAPPGRWLPRWVRCSKAPPPHCAGFPLAGLRFPQGAHARLRESSHVRSRVRSRAEDRPA